MKFYDAMVSIAASFGGSFDDAFLMFVSFLIVFLALLGWAVGCLWDTGLYLYGLSKKWVISFYTNRQKKKP